MKKKNFIWLILSFGIWGIVLMCGCSREAEFVDAHALEEEHPDEAAEQNSFSEETEETMPQEPEVVVVHMCGAVVNPGVYELIFGSRIADAVEMAGGFDEDADESYVNLAELPEDGAQIYIPTKDEAVILREESRAGSNSSGKVNINTADKSLLCTLPGIGETRAADIIAYRQKNGKFSSIEDIMQVSGIKEGSFQKIKELIVVN